MTIELSLMIAVISVVFGVYLWVSGFSTQIQAINLADYKKARK